MSRRLWVVLWTMLSASLSAAATAAESSSDVISRQVSYADLDLTTDKGVERLYGRITSAAEFVCDRSNVRSLVAVVEKRECTERAIARAIADVNAPRLTSLRRE
jgi:UrcA family protein